jgi:hypothetical protein
MPPDISGNLNPQPATNGAKKPRKKRVEDSKFPYRMDFGITAEMFAAVKRMMRGPYKQSQIGQQIFHCYFLQYDPRYAALMKDDDNAQ